MTAKEEIYTEFASSIMFMSVKDAAKEIRCLVEKREQAAWDARGELHPTKFAERKYKSIEEWRKEKR